MNIIPSMYPKSANESRPSYFINSCESYNVCDPQGYKINSNSSKYLGESLFKYSGQIKYSYNLANSIRHFVIQNIYESLECMKDPYSFGIPQEYGFVIKRFFVSLKAYFESYEETYRLGNNFLIDGILDKTFSDKLKELRMKSFLKSSVSSSLIDDSENYDVKTCPRITDIGQIFNYNYWIPWEEDDPEDYKYAEIQVKPYSQHLVKELEDLLYSVLPDSVETVFEEEILLKTSGSSCLKDHTIDLSKVYKEKEYSNFFSNTPLEGKRCVIRVSPSNTRDTVILSVPQSNSVKLIEAQVSRIVSKIQGSSYGKSPKDFDSDLEDFYESFEYFYDRDIKKEGITRPQELNQLMLRVLKKKYPNFPAWKYSGIYNGYKLHLETGEVLDLKRGNGLGMGNALATLMQVLINSLILKRINEDEQFMEDKCGFLTYNDDYSAGFVSIDDRDKYIETDLDICKELQIIPNLKKSHKLQKGFVFCETYYPKEFSRKKSYYLTELYYSFCAVNITEAKRYFQSICHKVNTLDRQNLLERLVSYWGYEFFPDEWKFPYSFGGWISPRIRDVRLDFMCDPTDEAVDAFYSIIEAKAYINPIKREKKESYSHFKLRKKELKGKLYNSPLNQVYGHLEFPRYLNNFFDFDSSLYDIERKHCLYNNPDLYSKYFQNLFNERQKLFLRKNRFRSNKDVLFQYFIENNPFVEILPPLEYIRAEEICSEVENELHFCRSSLPNKNLSIIKYFNNDKISDKIVPSLESIRETIENEAEVYFYEKRGALQITNGVEVFENTLEYSIPSKIKRDEKDFISFNHKEMQFAFEQITFLKKYPIYTGSASRKPEIIEYITGDTCNILNSKYRDIYIKLVEIIGYSNCPKTIEFFDNLVNSNVLDDIIQEQEKVEQPTILENEEKVASLNIEDLMGCMYVPEDIYFEKSDLKLYFQLGGPIPSKDEGFERIFFDIFNLDQVHRRANLALQERFDESLLGKNFSPMMRTIILLNNLTIYQKPGRNEIILLEPLSDSSSDDEETFDLGLSW